MVTSPVRTFLADASFLIDLCMINRSIINLFAQYEDGVCVVRNVLEEVHKLSEKEASRRRMRIIDPDICVYAEDLLSNNSWIGKIIVADFLNKYCAR